MREILFRGKRIDNGEWIEGYFVYCKSVYDYEKTAEIIPREADRIYRGEYDLYDVREVDPDTVGQYTGRTDKNGKRIFEGDIVKTHYANTPKVDFVEQVVFHNGRFCSMYEHDKMKMWTPIADGIKHLPQDKSVYMEWCEVIGNIHDNPELLGEGEDNG